jgi:hypothetical protein
MAIRSTWAGGCHCQAVRFDVDLPDQVDVEICNCSICAMSGNDHIIVPAACFRLTAGADMLTRYQFHTGTAQHLFCRKCGVKSFYIPRSNPDGYAVTWKCLDDADALDVHIEAFDGINWEDNAARLASKSKEPEL